MRRVTRLALPSVARGSSAALVFGALLLATAACGPKPPATAVDTAPVHHAHLPPHGGTPVVLGAEVYHLELVREADSGKLVAYVLDGEMENFIRSAETAFSVEATVKGKTNTLLFHPVANAATGETVGDTAQFEAQADWLKAATSFDGVIQKFTVRGTTFEKVSFNFPRGNDKD